MIYSTIRVLALVFVAVAPTITLAQSSTLTTPPTSTTTRNNAPGPMSLECWRITTSAGAETSVSVSSPQPSIINDPNARCWEVYSIGGGTARVPVTATNVNFAPTAVASGLSDDNSDGSINNSVKIIVPVLIGSLVAIVSVVVGTVWYRRRLRRREVESSRVKRWAEQNSNWALKGQGQNVPVQVSVQARRQSDVERGLSY